MRLELINFRCWRKRTFDFPDEGLVLLSGSSGSGKTSILSAIYFVLYGTGTKIISFGEKKCSVRFVYDGLDITRTKGPNRLMLSVVSGGETSEYEDDVAQGIITKKFGTNFTLTSYITQKTVQSFLNLGPTDKMNFLEQLALGDEDISGIKKKVKERIREKKDALSQKVGQLELLTAEVGEMKTPEEISFPLGPKHSDIKIKNEGVFWKRTIKELKEKRETLKTTEGEFSKEKVSRAVREGKQSSLVDLEKKREALQGEISSIEFDGEETINELKSTLSFLKNKREFSSVSDRYNEEKTRYDDLYTQEMSLLKEEETRLKETRDSIDEENFSDKVLKGIEEEILLIESIVSISKELEIHEKNRSQYREYDREEKVKELESKMEKLQEEISVTERRVDIKCCPNCKVSLRFSKTSLVLADGDPVDEAKSKIEIKRIKSEIAGCKTLIDAIKKEIMTISYTDTKIDEYKERLKLKRVPQKTLEELKNETKSLREMKREWTELSSGIKTVMNKIKTDDLSSTLKKLKLQVDKRKRELQSIKEQLEEELETDYTEEELREEISKQELASQKRKSLEKQLRELEVSISKLEKEIEKIVLSDRDFEEEIEKISKSIKELITKEEEHKRLDKEIERYLQYRKEEEDYRKWVDKLQKCREEEESAKRELAYCDIFLRKVQEAESLAISNVIDQINYSMNYYLERFFPENPITVEIKTFKETKKDIKPSINITVGYRGIENSSLDSLSGGEYDRIVLSLTLALSNLFGSNLILLDESISSLDGELSNDILECLKENMKEKLIVVVAHQISVGIFDTVLDIND
ncbi:MAG: AAA family ATPase [Candidatus Colwellbacteria bacterium]|nr:AAA family ATPase [Candidatus Colwellbacteria bacterium]